ncbi:kinase-like domain-containing protein [Pelagophyceae sp. CCMP2097]|nr:kinase-like domain-containing protein [Pelagophyceae sp. CCMP2097]
MFLSPVPGSPADDDPPTPVDYYHQTKQIFGCMSVNDSGGFASPPLSNRPKKRNKVGTPRSRASTATMECGGDDDGASSNDETADDDLEGYSLRMPGELSARISAAETDGRGRLSMLQRAGPSDEPPAANVNPFAPAESRSNSMTRSRSDSMSDLGHDSFLSRSDSFDLSGRSEAYLDLAGRGQQASSSFLPPPLTAPRGRWGATPRAPSRAEPPEPPDNDTPSRFRSDFEVIKNIGSGSFGTVHKVRCRIDGCLYAVKSTRARFKGSVHREQTLKEVFALAALSSNAASGDGLKHVVRYYQAWIEDERLFIQTELCDASLETRLAANRGDWAPDQVFSFLRQLLLALELLHSKQLVHLDIKPGNVFVQGATYKLGDFGLAARATGGGDVVEGDSRYMSRELLDDDDFRAASAPPRDLTKCDVFSLGATAYEICTGQPLPANGARWHALRDGRLDPLPSADMELCACVARMMHADAPMRPRASELLQLPRLQSEVQLLALQLVKERAHVEVLQQDRSKNETMRRQRLARSNTWA